MQELYIICCFCCETNKPSPLGSDSFHIPVTQLSPTEHPINVMHYNYHYPQRALAISRSSPNAFQDRKLEKACLITQIILKCYKAKDWQCFPLMNFIKRCQFSFNEVSYSYESLFLSIKFVKSEKVLPQINITFLCLKDYVTLKMDNFLKFDNPAI